MEKLLTISIAAYNMEKYLENTLKSLLNNNVIDKIEIIIENDGSTDNTLMIGQRYQNMYPESIRLINKENGGYGSTINRSIEEAKGKYFKQLDGDDWFVNLESFVESIENVEADLVVSPYRCHFEEDNTEKRYDLFEKMETGLYDFDQIVNIKWINMYAITYKTGLLKKFNYKIREHCFYTDTEYSHFPLCMVENVYVDKTDVYVYRVGREGQSMSADGIAKHYKEHELVLYDMIKVLNNSIFKRENARLILSERIKIEASLHAKYLCILPFSVKNWKKLRAYIKRKKKCPYALTELMDNSGFLKMIIKTDCLAYPILRIIAIKEFNQSK